MDFKSLVWVTVKGFFVVECDCKLNFKFNTLLPVRSVATVSKGTFKIFSRTLKNQKGEA